MSVFILENISKSYKVNKKETFVLKDINLTFPDKGLVSIVGKSGSGKSTLLNIMMGIEKPTSGSICFKHKEISKYKDKEFSSYHLSGISYIFQHYNLFNDITVKENIILPLLMKGISRKKSLEIAENELAKFRITDLGTRIVKNLSGGEKQRVAIIRALVTKPNVILCDEPTGALDFKNSEEIMGILKKISQRILVIMVSHNDSLVRRYSDQIIKLDDGKVVDNVSSIKNTFTSKYEQDKVRYSSKWIRIFFRKNLIKNRYKNIFSIIACSIGFTAMLLSAGFSIGSKSSQNEALMKNLSIGFATISESKTIEIPDSPLLFQKTTRPDISLVDETFSDFKSIRYEENTSYFLSCYSTCKYEDETISNYQMVPLYDLSLESYGKNLLVYGTGGQSNFEEVIINEEFENMVGHSLLGETLVFQNSSYVNYKTNNEENPLIKDYLTIIKPLKVVGIVKEFPFLNTPKIYYSYQGGRDFLKSQIMENVSSFLGKQTSFYDYLSSCQEDDPVCSYSSYLFLEDVNEFDRFIDRVSELEGSSIEITSTAIEIQDTYASFIGSFSNTLIVFVIIAFIGINFILGMISFSTFIENKKSTAIMTCLGSRNSSIHNLYLLENYLVIFLAFVFSVLISYFSQGYLNSLIEEKYSLSNLITIPFYNFYEIRYGLILALFSIAIIFSTIFTTVPMFIYRNKSITDELRDE